MNRRAIVFFIWIGIKV